MNDLVICGMGDLIFYGLLALFLVGNYFRIQARRREQQHTENALRELTRQVKELQERVDQK